MLFLIARVGHAIIVPQRTYVVAEKRAFVIDLINEVKALIKERDEAVAALKEKSEN